MHRRKIFCGKKKDGLGLAGFYGASTQLVTFTSKMLHSCIRKSGIGEIKKFV